jgi:hypothetical protein
LQKRRRHETGQVKRKENKRRLGNNKSYHASEGITGPENERRRENKAGEGVFLDLSLTDWFSVPLSSSSDYPISHPKTPW